MVIEVNRAVAVAMARGPRVGLEILLRLEGQAGDYYPHHAARTDLLRRMKPYEAAAEAYERTLALCRNAAERDYFQRRLDEMTRA